MKFFLQIHKHKYLILQVNDKRLMFTYITQLGGWNMCFSAEASFSAAAVLGAAGYFTAKKATHRHLLMLAFIPLLLAIQQFSEGVLWLTLGNETPLYTIIAGFAKISFLIFAFLVWPIWIPLALIKAESESWRKKVLFFLLAAGVLFDLTTLYYLITNWSLAGTPVKIVQHSIHYIMPVGEFSIATILYLASTVFAPLVSSLYWIWIFGIANLIGFTIADYFYNVTFISVWCFFAAWVSFGVYFVICKNSTCNSPNAKECPEILKK